MEQWLFREMQQRRPFNLWGKLNANAKQVCRNKVKSSSEADVL